MQLLMRRPDTDGFVALSPPATKSDFSFLAPCPSSGLIINGTKDDFAVLADIQKLVTRPNDQKGINIAHCKIVGAGHFFEGAAMDRLEFAVKKHLTVRAPRLKTLGQTNEGHRKFDAHVPRMPQLSSVRPARKTHPPRLPKFLS